MVSSNESYKKSGTVVKRKIADGIILVPVKKTAEELDSIYAINEVAGRMWELIDGEKSLREIKEIILKEYEVSPEDLEEDIKTFVNLLKSENLIEIK